MKKQKIELQSKSNLNQFIIKRDKEPLSLIRIHSFSPFKPIATRTKRKLKSTHNFTELLFGMKQQVKNQFKGKQTYLDTTKKQLRQLLAQENQLLVQTMNNKWNINYHLTQNKQVYQRLTKFKNTKDKASKSQYTKSQGNQPPKNEYVINKKSSCDTIPLHTTNFRCKTNKKISAYKLIQDALDIRNKITVPKSYLSTQNRKKIKDYNNKQTKLLYQQQHTKTKQNIQKKDTSLMIPISLIKKDLKNIIVQDKQKKQSYTDWIFDPW